MLSVESVESKSVESAPNARDDGLWRGHARGVLLLLLLEDCRGPMLCHVESVHEHASGVAVTANGRRVTKPITTNTRDKRTIGNFAAGVVGGLRRVEGRPLPVMESV